jgi:uncharacterized membrane protein YdjX (TVP38/TMEM64 family)
MGLTKMRIATFFWVSVVGILPSCFLYVLAGTQLRQLQSPGDILSWQLVTILLILAVMPLFMKWLFRRRAARAEVVQTEQP